MFLAGARPDMPGDIFHVIRNSPGQTQFTFVHEMHPYEIHTGHLANPTHLDWIAIIVEDGKLDQAVIKLIAGCPDD